MVFTQYIDTMDFLRDTLLKDADWRLMCFSGRGGEIPSADGSWRRIGRDGAKRRFRDSEADILLGTDAAAEGLNFQFCGALTNYEMPWNPMRVEQRIGRSDRLGQQNQIIRIVNRVTTDPEYFEEHAASLELWSPGNALFQAPDVLAPTRDGPPAASLKGLLERLAQTLPVDHRDRQPGSCRSLAGSCSYSRIADLRVLSRF